MTTYNYQDNIEKPVKAAVILFYKQDKGMTKFLLVQRYGDKKKIQHTSEYQDLGGKVEKCDNSIAHIALREALEEVRDMANINEKRCMKQMQKAQSQFYVHNSKYLMYLIEADDIIENLKCDQLYYEPWEHDEKHGKTKCMLKWLTIDEVDNLVINQNNIAFDDTGVNARIISVWKRIYKVFPIITYQE
ncbi:Conserved_hypothetical protein [Hexamita inflata]|uniref:Nudix hydrolase domain-containing protein n=1 Tax=Hexamita inflata TaxID=28002 RepID=A0AA86TIQ5_9EUKA|nr:Conserved hypothetical protein [Hexamita inflata]